MVSGVNQQNVDMQRQMAVNHYAVCQDMSDIKQRLTWLTKTVQENADNIQDLYSRLRESEQYADTLHRQMDRLQSDLRRKNLKLMGMDEDCSETSTSLTGQIVSTLNTYSSSDGFTVSSEDIDDAVRVGNPSGRMARTVIVTFRNRELPKSLMTNRECRQSMARAMGIRLGPDLTPAQHREMLKLRAEGKRGYLKKWADDSRWRFYVQHSTHLEQSTAQ
ncbi:hypothetical protein ACOMHN_007565 [Nucella lapillus]